jgi:hypothetical protein
VYFSHRKIASDQWEDVAMKSSAAFAAAKMRRLISFIVGRVPSSPSGSYEACR